MTGDKRSLGKYEILEEIGKGGFATVYRARDTVLGREVALKVLDPMLMRDREFVERFRREAQATAGLQHPNLVTLFDLGESEGLLFIIAEYLPGGTLKERLAQGPMSLSRAAEVVAQIGAALDYAHEQGIIHRDVKPSNILFDGRGQAKLSDFGIVKAASGTQFTTMGVALGTPEYMAPEQAEGRPLDGRADLYALGIVAYEMVTGQVPFTGDTPSTVHYKHVHQPPPPPAEMAPGAPRQVSDVLLKALAKEPDGRYATGAELSAALHAAVERSAQVHWNRLLAKAEALLAQGELDAAAVEVERLVRERPGDAAVAALQARIQRELALRTTYAEAHEHLQQAVRKAGQVLAERADYPDPQGVFETLQLRGATQERPGRRAPQQPTAGEVVQPKPATTRQKPRVSRQQMRAPQTLKPREKAQRNTARSAAWWLLGLSIVPGLAALGAGIIGIVGAVAMLKGRVWGRKVGLAFAHLYELAGLVAAVGIVIGLSASHVFASEARDYWLLCTAALLGMSMGVFLARLLSRESVLRSLGEESRWPACAWPIAMPMMLTGLGIIPAIGLLRRKEWGRIAMTFFLGVFALAAILAAVVVGQDMEVHHYDSSTGTRYWTYNAWGFAIAMVEAAVVTIWCVVGILYLRSARVKAWYKDDAFVEVEEGGGMV